MNWLDRLRGHVQQNKTAYAKGGGLTGVALAVAIAAVAQYEGYSGKPYFDSVHVKTICYGATAADGVDFSKTYSKAECEAMLGKDLQKYDAQIQKCIKPEVYSALPPRRHAALVSLDYNIGAGNFCRSSVVRELNAGRVQSACNAFMNFNRAGGRVLKGLTTRRESERKLCLRND